MGSSPTPASIEYDPERALWVPGRRKFFFGLGALAAVAALGIKPLPAAIPAGTPAFSATGGLAVGDIVSFAGVEGPIAGLQQLFVVTGLGEGLVTVAPKLPDYGWSQFINGKPLDFERAGN